MEHKIKLKIAIGLQKRSGCIIEIVEDENEISKDDVEEYGGSLEEFFYEGSKPPKEAGLYMFDGKAHYTDQYQYIGTFTRIDI